MRQSLSQKPIYVQQGFLGKGSFAQVYKVIINSQPYALKRVYGYQLKNPLYYKCIKRQISIMRKLNHPNIVKLIDVYETQNTLQLLLQYLSGGNLYDKIKCQDRLPQYLVKRYILDIIHAIKYLHSFPQPILHRDIKPQNILISESGTLKLCDFGSANMLVPDHHRDSYVGTPQYMAPEMKQCQPHDKSLDLWCIGILIYQLLTGCIPNQQKQIDFPDYISRSVQNLIKRILVKQQNQRMNIEQIQNHIWFTNSQIIPEISNFTLEIQSLNNNDMIQRINAKNNVIGLKINKIKQLPIKTEPVSNLSVSSMTKIAEQDALIYIKQLKQIAILQNELKNNENKIKKNRILNNNYKKLNEKQNKLIVQKIQQIENKQIILQQKQYNLQQKCIICLQNLIQKLNNLYNLAHSLPKLTTQKILYFQDIKQQNTLSSINESLPKLKLKILQQKRNALIQLKCIKKRKKEMESMLYGINKQQSFYQICYNANGNSQQSLKV